ncbi:MAG TPA: hypothetical protein VF525_15620 [Pyrinomonadaceae bacterium]|jgi:hypothetical protein
MGRQKIIYISHIMPAEVGNGGVHRGYQILHQLSALVGREQILLFTPETLRAGGQNGHARPHGGVGRQLKEWATFRAGTLRRAARNPYRLLQRTNFVTGLHPALKAFYEEQIKGLAGQAVCVIDHTQFSELLPLNRKHGIPTISCTQNFDALAENFEALTTSLHVFGGGQTPRQQVGVYAALTDFANELQFLAQCDERLFISKLETGVTGSLGLRCHYHPYVPVGALRAQAERIRQRRETSARAAGLFLFVGTAAYGPIGKSCEWLIENVRQHGLPQGVRLVGVGAGTERLLPAGEVVPGLELKGWVEQAELDELLVQARAVLVPQQFGFGALTRLPELSCAGIPVIGCQHPSWAIDPPPGFEMLEAAWPAWAARIEQLSRAEQRVFADDYDAWAAAQPQPLAHVISRLLDEPARAAH